MCERLFFFRKKTETIQQYKQITNPNSEGYSSMTEDMVHAVLDDDLRRTLIRCCRSSDVCPTTGCSHTVATEGLAKLRAPGDAHIYGCPHDGVFGYTS